MITKELVAVIHDLYGSDCICSVYNAGREFLPTNGETALTLCEIEAIKEAGFAVEVMGITL